MTGYVESLQRVLREKCRSEEFRAFLPRLAAEFPGLITDPRDEESAEREIYAAIPTNARLQQVVAYALNYVPSRWLLEQERFLIRRRRRLFRQHCSRRRKREDIYEWANRNQLAGLCLSGGGIRSATFNLGLLQSLAARGWLSSFDYISSVSGGGYIHGWLAAWFKRRSDALATQNAAEGQRAGDGRAAKRASTAQAMQEVEAQMRPLAEEKGAAAEPFPAFSGTAVPKKQPSATSSTPRSFWSEEIKWLRRYSNYLTPETGFLSLDSWAAGAVWLRNTFLTQLVLVSLLLLGLLLLQPFCRPAGNGKAAGPGTQTMRVGGTAQGELDTRSEHLASFALQLQLAPPPGHKLTFEEFSTDYQAHFQEAVSWLKDTQEPSALARGDRTREQLWQRSHAGWFTILWSRLLAIAFFASAIAFGVLFHREWDEIHAADLAAIRSGKKAESPCSSAGVPPEASGLHARHPVALSVAIVAFLVLPSWPLLFQVLYAGYGWRTEAAVLAAMVVLSVSSSIGGRAWETLRINEFFAPRGKGKDPAAQRRHVLARHLLCWTVPPVIATALFIVFSTLLRTALQEGWGSSFVAIHAQPGVEVTFGIPLVSMLPYLMLVLQAGITGSLVEDWVLELFARLRAMAVLFAVISLLLFFLALLSPDLLNYLLASKTLKISTVAVWVFTTVGGVLSGKSARVSGDAADKGSFGLSSAELLATVAPYVYLAGLLVLLAGAAQWCVGLPWSHSRFLLSVGLTMAVLLVFGLTMDATTFSMFPFYRDRLTRCYLGASNISRDPLPLSGFDNRDTKGLLLQCLEPREGYPGPLPLFCATINLTTGEDLAYQERKGASFVFSPVLCGYVSPWTEGKRNTGFCGYVPTKEYAGSAEIDLPSVMAISGAAVSPNWGFHSKPATAFLMTMFNARLGRWVPNPRHQENGLYQPPTRRPSLYEVLRELFGKSDDSSEFVYLSDGGHFDNMGLYELVRRRCQRIVISDAEQDASYTFEGISGAIRKCRIDFSVEIKLDLTALRPADKPRFSTAHWIEGTIHYPDRLESQEPLIGKILYIKSSLRGFPASEKASSSDKSQPAPGNLPDMPGDLQGYWLQHETFPHDSTLNQWFTEDQFESYRRLGQSIGDSLPDQLFREPGETPLPPSSVPPSPQRLPRFC